MIRYFVKLELKKSLIYYLLLALFFMFWSFFSLLGLSLYDKISQVQNFYKKNFYLSLIFYPEKNNNIEDFVSKLKELPGVKKLEVIPPSQIYNSLASFVSSNVLKSFSKKEILTSLPYLIKLYPSSFEQYSQMLKYLKTFFTGPQNKLVPSAAYRILTLIGVMKKAGIVFFLLWCTFYVMFLLFLNYLLELNLKSQAEVIILLGGSAIGLKILRSFLVMTFLLLGFIPAFVSVFYLLKEISTYTGLNLYLNYNSGYLIFWLIFIVLIPTLVGLKRPK